MDRLVERVDKLREEISMYEAQMTAQSEETKATKDALGEAQMELEVRYSETSMKRPPLWVSLNHRWSIL